MKYEIIKNYKPEKFRRITGLKIETFKRCLIILNKKHAEEHITNVRKSGRKAKLSMENRLLATLEYLREYRTYAHIAANYDVHESQIVRCVRWVETTLIKDGTFRLPGKKELLKPDTEYEVVLIDATETPIERQKRGKNFTTQERKNDTR
jgi:transposase-like protein